MEHLAQHPEEFSEANEPRRVLKNSYRVHGQLKLVKVCESYSKSGMQHGICPGRQNHVKSTVSSAASALRLFELAGYRNFYEDHHNLLIDIDIDAGFPLCVRSTLWLSFNDKLPGRGCNTLDSCQTILYQLYEIIGEILSTLHYNGYTL